MKNIIIGLLILVALTSCQQSEKFGFVDSGEVINNYQEKLDIEEKYKVRNETLKRRTDSISQAFQLEAQDFQIKSRSMSQKKAQEMYDQLLQKQQLLQQQIQFEEQQLQQAFNVEIDSAIVKFKDYVNGYGSKNGYTYIFGTSENSNSVLYGKEQDDLTKIILDSLNAEYSKN